MGLWSGRHRLRSQTAEEFPGGSSWKGFQGPPACAGHGAGCLGGRPGGPAWGLHLGPSTLGLSAGHLLPPSARSPRPLTSPPAANGPSAAPSEDVSVSYLPAPPCGCRDALTGSGFGALHCFLPSGRAGGASARSATRQFGVRVPAASSSAATSSAGAPRQELLPRPPSTPTPSPPPGAGSGPRAG